LLSKLYDALAKNYIALKQPEKAVLFLQKRDQQKAKLDDKDQIKEVIAQYIRRQTEKKQAALQLAKENAEKLAVATRAKARLNYWILGLLSLFLAGTVLVYYTFYRQKKSAAEQLAQINQLLEGEKEKLVLSNNKLKRFSGVVSHDILSNLDLILSTGNVLVGTRPNPENLNKYYTLTQNTGRQLKEYCLGLLAEAKASPEIALFDIGDPNTVLNRIIERFGPALQEKGFSVEIGELPNSRLPLSVVEQVLQNLVSNTLRYASQVSSPRLQIGSGINEQGRLCWYVADNGPGQAAEINRVIQGEQAASAKGQGVGLNLLQATLLDYGWGLQAEAVDGGGVRMVVGSRG
jgi:signal transduction histidine kinase